MGLRTRDHQTRHAPSLPVVYDCVNNPVPVNPEAWVFNATSTRLVGAYTRSSRIHDAARSSRIHDAALSNQTARQPDTTLLVPLSYQQET